MRRVLWTLVMANHIPKLCKVCKGPLTAKLMCTKCLKGLVRLWHDDVRKPPDSSWFWARNNEDAKLIFTNYNVGEVSLDHDLGMDWVDPNVEGSEYLKGSSESGSGYDLVRWMCETKHLPSKITVHSWNPVGAERMVLALRDAGCYVKIQPYTPIN